MSDLNIAVLGGGVIGLTTAIELQKLYRNANIDLIAAGFQSDTTSSVAAGLFRPGTSFCGPNEEITRRWITDAYRYWDDLRNSSEGALAGVTEVSGYLFSSKYPHIVRNHYLEKLVPLYRPATEQELKLCPGNWKYGSFFTTIVTSCEYYLPWATNKFLEKGGKIQKHHIKDIASISKGYDVLVNCTGLGAKYLCNDNKLVAIRGQVIKVEAPWIRTFFYGDYDTYIIPGFNSVTLGGCRQYDSYDHTVNKYDSLNIREKCEALVPNLKSAKTVKELVGLRPHRDPVRVEKEVRHCNGQKIKIVHNYGHGGYGVTTAPGTALYACELVRESLAGNSKL
nr:unnamed protein product [Callosobruchus analis]